MTSFASGYSYSKCIQYAGKEADAVNMDYDVKYSQQTQAIKGNYAIFGMPYNGKATMIIWTVRVPSMMTP